jgi:hypothetical protein
MKNGKNLNMNFSARFCHKRNPMHRAMFLSGFVFFIFLLWSSSVFAAIALVQSDSIDWGSTASGDLAFPGNNTAGNLIVVAVRRGSNSGTVTVTDSQGNTYYQAISQASGTDHASFVFYAQNIKGGANTVTTTFSVSQTMRFSIHEFSGVAKFLSVDKTSSSSGSSTSPDSGSKSISIPNELIFGAISTDGAPSYTVGGSFTLLENVSNKILTEYRIVSSTGSYSASATLGVSDPWTSEMVTFRDISNGVNDAIHWGGE